MRGFAGLVRHDLARLVMRRRAWLFSAAFALSGVGWMLVNRDSTYALPGSRVHPTGPMLALGAVDTLSGLVLFAPLLLGGTLAEDRLSGLSRLLLSRGGSRLSWVASKAASSALVSLGFFLAFGVLVTAAAASIAGWEKASFAHVVGVRTGLAAHPLLLILAACGVLALAATATASLSSLAAFFVRSPAASLVVPVIAIFAAALAMPPWCNPSVRAGFLGLFFAWNSLGSVFAYWTGLLCLSCATTGLLAWLREE